MLAITHQISHPEVIHTLGDSAMSPIFVFRRPLWDRLICAFIRKEAYLPIPLLR